MKFPEKNHHFTLLFYSLHIFFCFFSYCTSFFTAFSVFEICRSLRCHYTHGITTLLSEITLSLDRNKLFFTKRKQKFIKFVFFLLEKDTIFIISCKKKGTIWIISFLKKVKFVSFFFEKQKIFYSIFQKCFTKKKFNLLILMNLQASVTLREVVALFPLLRLILIVKGLL